MAVKGAPLSFLRDARSALRGLRQLCVESSRGGEEVVKLAAYRRAVVVEAELELLLEDAKAAATPRCALPPEDEALLIDAYKAGATADEKRDLAKRLCEKNGLPWLEDEPPNWSEKPSE
jgi:hypothetical protein